MKTFILIFAKLSLLFASVKSIEISGFTLNEEALDNDTESNSGRAYQDPNAIKFFLYRNPLDEDERVEMLLNDVLSLYTCGYNFSQPLILLIHGVLSHSLTLHDVQVLKNEYLRSGMEANIIIADYGPLTVSHKPFVFSSLSFMTILVNNQVTNVVAQRVSEFIHFLLIQRAVSGPEDIHLIGFSVGAHMAGAVGRNLYAWTGRKVGRVTGLDPSAQFAFRPKIEPTDAEFVDITLTSLGKLANFRNEGHAMFFVNGGGPHQSTCPNFLPFTETYCSHTTSVYYFAKSIRKRTFMGCMCRLPCQEEPEVCRMPVVYGEYTAETARGNYYVKI